MQNLHLGKLKYHSILTKLWLSIPPLISGFHFFSFSIISMYFFQIDLWKRRLLPLILNRSSTKVPFIDPVEKRTVTVLEESLIMEKVKTNNLVSVCSAYFHLGNSSRVYLFHDDSILSKSFSSANA